MSLEWRTTTIGDLCSKVSSGGTPKSTNEDYYGGDIPWLNTKEINFNRIYDTEKHITQEGFENSAAKWVKKDSVIVAMYGATAAKVAMNKVDLTTNQACCNLTIENTLANPKFIYYYLYSNYGRLMNLASGAAQQNLNSNLIKEFPISIPSLNVQNKIVNVLSTIDDKIEINKKINKNLTKLSSIIFINLLEKSNNFLELNRCCKFIKGKKPKKTSDYPQSNFLDYLTIDVLSNQSQTYAYDDKGILANEYDILMVMDGASSGKLFYGKSGLVGSTLAKLNVEEKYLEIVYQFLKQSEKFISDNTTGSAIPHTDKGLVLSLKCPISEELLNYSDMFKSIRSSIITNNNEILKLQKLRDTLLPKLMSGEIDVSKINCDLE